MAICDLCPRHCGTDRSKNPGFCGGTDTVRLARVSLHEWEEPVISGARGSGTVFFCGCSLGCVFCQNRAISRGGVGKEVSVLRLADIFREVEALGAHNINLVTPMHYAPQIIKALELAKPTIPVAINSGGYESPETVRLFSGYASVFMPDLKCVSSEISRKYMNAPDYFERACECISAMHELAPKLTYLPDGTLKRGLIVRHLILPGHRADSIRVLDALNALLPPKSWLLSLMSQFTPTENCKNYPEINRKITSFEYSSVAKHAVSLGMDGFMQEKSSASEDFIPDFDLRGV